MKNKTIIILLMLLCAISSFAVDYSKYWYAPNRFANASVLNHFYVSAKCEFVDSVEHDGDVTFNNYVTFNDTLDIAYMDVGNVNGDGTFNIDQTVTTGTSEGHDFKTTFAAGDTFSGTNGFRVKSYFGDSTTVVNGGEFTCYYANMKLLSTLSGGAKSVIYSGHNYNSSYSIDAGVWLYGKFVDGFKISGDTIETGLDLSETVVSGADIIGGNGDTLFNSAAGTWSFGNSDLTTSGDLTAQNANIDSITSTITLQDTVNFEGKVFYKGTCDFTDITPDFNRASISQITSTITDTLIISPYLRCDEYVKCNDTLEIDGFGYIKTGGMYPAADAYIEWAAGGSGGITIAGDGAIDLLGGGNINLATGSVIIGSGNLEVGDSPAKVNKFVKIGSHLAIISAGIDTMYAIADTTDLLFPTLCDSITIANAGSTKVAWILGRPDTIVDVR